MDEIKILKAALLELRQIHSFVDPTCIDQGPSTCPTWEAIYGLQDLLKKLEEGS